MKKEDRLEDAIVDHLCESSGFTYVDYRDGEAKGRYDKTRALDPALVLGVYPKDSRKGLEKHPRRGNGVGFPFDVLRAG